MTAAKNTYSAAVDELIEVYPGIDIDRDILSQMAFPVKVADNLK